MNSRRRVTAALIALLSLVVGVWLAQHVLSAQPSGTPQTSSISTPDP